MALSSLNHEPLAEAKGNVFPLFGNGDARQRPFRRFLALTGAAIGPKNDEPEEAHRLTVQVKLDNDRPITKEFIRTLTLTLTDPDREIELTLGVSAYAVDGTTATLLTTRLQNVYEGTVFGRGSTLQIKGRADESLCGPIVTLLQKGIE
jgi:hypothetical protein